MKGMLIADEFDNFVALGLNKDPSGRMLARNMIAHPWIYGRNRAEDKRLVASVVARAIEARSRARANPNTAVPTAG